MSGRPSQRILNNEQEGNQKQDAAQPAATGTGFDTASDGHADRQADQNVERQGQGGLDHRHRKEPGGGIRLRQVELRQA